jgi:leucyl-tRNA synthetase
MYKNFENKKFKINNNLKIISEYNKLIKEFSNDIEKLKFNVAISKLMIFVNIIYKEKESTKEAISKFPLLLSLFAPHISEEILNNLKELEISKNK